MHTKIKQQYKMAVWITYLGSYVAMQRRDIRSYIAKAIMLYKIINNLILH